MVRSEEGHEHRKWSLRMRAECGDLRAAGVWTQNSDPSVDWSQPPTRKGAVVGLQLATVGVLLALFAAVPARAASSAAAPDRAPNSGAAPSAAAASSTNSPGPDPAPQAATAVPHFTGSSSAPTGGGLVAVGRSQAPNQTTPSTGTLTIHTPTAVPLLARPSAHRVRTQRGQPFARALPTVALTLVRIRGLVSHVLTATTLPIVVANHDGRLLLLSGLALGMLVIASAAMLRLLTRLGKEEWLK
jgi:hypothetical protein